MTILTRQERERLVLDLYYNQGKTYREISKEARISPRDIGVILNRVIKEKAGGLKEERQQQDNNDTENIQEEHQHLSLSTQAYKLFFEGKTPLEVAVALNLRESEATKYCREYWKLKQLHNLDMVYEEVKDDIGYFVKLYKLSKAKRMEVQKVVNLLKIANDDLPAIEDRLKRLGTTLPFLHYKIEILLMIKNAVIVKFYLFVWVVVLRQGKIIGSVDIKNVLLCDIRYQRMFANYII
jgi:transposase